MHSIRTRLVAAVATLALLAACDDGTAPDQDTRPTEALNFLRPSPDAPPLANPEVTFWAKRGDDREATIYYRPRPGETDSLEFVFLKIAGEALYRRPDGTLFQHGDSVRITMRVADPARLIIEFEPTGLQFSPTKPAELEISFHEANDDVDGDGDLDDDDDDARRQLSLWRQERPGHPWVRIGSIIDFDLEEVDADLFGFSGYAIAF